MEAKKIKERIEEEIRLKSGSIDLQNLGISQVPKELKDMAWLRHIDLDNNQIKKLEGLPSGLTSLSIRINQIGKLEFLPESLLQLDISNNQISKLESLPNSLTKLDISNNLITKLKSLPIALTKLDVSRNLISKLESLPQSLLQLDIWGNQISKLESLPESLTMLNVSGNQISKLESLPESLTKLDVSGNQISKLESLPQNLKEFGISDNKVGKLENLPTSLNTINIQQNEISCIEGLPSSLKILAIGGNKINRLEALPDGLEKLYIWKNEITSIESFPESLTFLNLRGNQISKIEGLPKRLKELIISDNQIKELKGLNSSLTTLEVNNNLIEKIDLLPSSITRLDLRNNQIRDFSPLMKLDSIFDLKIKNKGTLLDKNGFILINGNPVTNPPKSIVETGHDAIIEYFSRQEKEELVPLREAKLILLGDGRAGKSTLVSQLLGTAPPEEKDRTIGVKINIGDYIFTCPKTGEPFKLHICDFGGQDKYKLLHQFFYTTDALYVMVADSGNAGTNYDDWLQSADLYGGSSPLLIVLNEFSQGMGYGNYDDASWKSRFPTLLKESFICNLLTGENVENLKQAIHYHASLLEHTQKNYFASWMSIRETLEQREAENVLPLHEYFRLCEEHGLDKKSALILSRILHTLGVCLHYQENDLLKQQLILKNEWATDAVYKFLEDETVAEIHKGRFNTDDLKRIWSKPQYEDLRPQLLELMKVFRLAYPLADSEEYIAPILLPQRIPEGIPTFVNSCIKVILEYDFLPKALLTQFIVTRHKDIAEQRTLVWREGVVLEWKVAKAIIRKTKSRGRVAFTVNVEGPEDKALLTSIINTFDQLHLEYEGLKVHKIIPCRCTECEGAVDNKFHFDYDDVTNRIHKGRLLKECDRSFDEVNLLELLSRNFIFTNLTKGTKPIMYDETNKQIVRVFLASSNELVEQRTKVRNFFSEQNDSYVERRVPIYLKLENWEAMSEGQVQGRKQEEYNVKVRESDLFVCLVHTKVGKYTEEEYDVARDAFEQRGRPGVFVFFNEEGVSPLDVDSSVKAFADKIKTQDQYLATYSSYADLQNKLKKHIDSYLYALSLIWYGQGT